MLGIMGKAKSKFFCCSSFPASFASMLNVPMVHCIILLDGSCCHIFCFPHLRHLGTRQGVLSNPISMDTEGAIESVHINGVSALSR